MTSLLSAVAQSSCPMFLMFAMNISGKESARLICNDSLRLLFLPVVTVIGAQFMYISRVPILLCHVHAKV